MPGSAGHYPVSAQQQHMNTAAAAAQGMANMQQNMQQNQAATVNYHTTSANYSYYAHQVSSAALFGPCLRY